MADVGIKIRATDEASGVFGKVAAEAGKLQGAVSNVGSSFAALGTAAIAGMSVISFAGQIKQTIDLADSFNKLSQKTGIAVEDFSKLNYAASLADVSTETLAAGMRKLNLSIADAAGGNKEKAALFNALGVSFKDAAGQALSADKVFSSLSDALAKSADGAEKIAVGSDLMGKGFEGLVPLVNTGAKGLADMGDEAKKLGIVMGADFAKNAEEFNDNLRRINVAGQGLFVTLAGDLVKGLGDAAREMAQAAIDGGKLAGVIAGIQTLFTGTDQYKNDKKLVEQTELMLSLEKSLTVARKSGNAAYIKSREDALAAVNAEIKTTMSYRKLLQDMETDKKKNEPPKPTGVTPNVKAANALLGSSGNGPKTPKDTANAFPGEQEAAKEWAKAYEGATKARDDLIAKNLGLSKSEEDLKRYMESTAAAINEKTNPAMNAMVESALQANIALEAMGKLADVIEAQQKRTSTAEEETAKERDRVAAIGLTEQAIAELNATRLEEMATAKERSLMAAKEIDLSGELAESIKAEVKALRERAGLARLGSLKESEVAAAKAAADEWKRGWEETDRLGRQVWSDLTTQGENAADKIGKAFRTTVSSALYDVFAKPFLLQVYTSIAGGSAGGTVGALGQVGTAANGVSALSSIGSATGAGMLGSVFGSNAAYGAALGTTSVGAGSQAAMLAAQTGEFGAAGLSATAGAAGGTLGTVMAAAPYVVAALAVISLLKKDFVSATDSGRAAIDYNAAGVGSAAYRTTGDASQLATATNATNAIEKAYQDAAKSFGIKTIGGTFEVGYNTGAGGAHPNTGIGASFGGLSYSSGEVSSADTAAVQLAASRAVFTALQASELPGYLKTVFDGVTAGTATQAQIDNTLAYASSLKTVREAMLETRDPVQVLKDSVADGFKTLGTSAETFKNDFVAAIDAGISPENLSKWGNLKTAMDQLAPALDQVAAAAQSAVQNWGTSADVRNFKATQLQSTFAASGFNVDLQTILGATKETTLAYFNSLSENDTAKKVLYDNQQAIYDLVKTLEAPAQAAASSGGGGGGGGSPAPDTALSAWQDATDAIVETMADLRSALVGEGPNSFAKLQAQFVIETAKAKAGDLAAAQDLPELAKSLADANKANATSSVQQAIFTARIVETLGSVAGLGNLGRSISVPAFAAGGLHSGGWAMVGENGPELVNMPSARVYNAQDTRAMLGGQDNAALVEELRAVRAELAAIKAYAGSSAASGRSMAQVLDGAANGQKPLATEAV